MSEDEKVVIRFLNGRLLKGQLREFSIESQKIVLDDFDKGVRQTISVDELKAIFFVRSFEGHSEYREIKKYITSQREGRKIFIKFKDGESMVGYLQGDIPWNKGFFLSKPDEKKQDFFLYRQMRKVII
jgi:small nuclear ribonucleoprotein (snRNP)-like protein